MSALASKAQPIFMKFLCSLRDKEELWRMSTASVPEMGGERNYSM